MLSCHRKVQLFSDLPLESEYKKLEPQIRFVQLFLLAAEENQTKSIEENEYVKELIDLFIENYDKTQYDMYEIIRQQICYSCRSKNPIVQFILDCGFDPNYKPEHRSDSNQSLLCRAIYVGNDPITLMLLEKGAIYNQQFEIKSSYKYS